MERIPTPRGWRAGALALAALAGHTVLIVHNLELAERLPLRLGEAVRFRGKYEWNERGGVVHWTHGGPGGEPGGWVDHDGSRYE